MYSTRVECFLLLMRHVPFLEQISFKKIVDNFLTSRQNSSNFRFSAIMFIFYIAIFIFGPFGLKLPIHAHIGEFWGI